MILFPDTLLPHSSLRAHRLEFMLTCVFSCGPLSSRPLAYWRITGGPGFLPCLPLFFYLSVVSPCCFTASFPTCFPLLVWNEVTFWVGLVLLLYLFLLLLVLILIFVVVIIIVTFIFVIFIVVVVTTGVIVIVFIV